MATNPTPSYTEPHRPQFHFSPASGWTNDPNGLVYYNGEYHLFYQHHPYSTHWSDMHWGHAVSPDMLHWQHLPIALAPDAIGPIFSGSVVVDADNTSGLVPGGGLVAVFSYQNQSQGIASSRDNGRTWTKYSGNPVIPSPGGDFRDPKVFWHDASARWVMVIAAHDRVKFFQSPNLLEWHEVGEFGIGQGAHGGVWECPDLFPMTVDGATKWVLLVSVNPGAVAGGSGTQYFVGSFDGSRFTSHNPASTTLWLDYGRDNYAGVTWNNAPDGRRLFIGWMNNWEYANETPASIWNGVMTIPRELTLRDFPDIGLRLVLTPISEVERLRHQSVVVQPTVISSASDLLLEADASLLEIIAEFELGTAAECGLKLLNGGETSIVIGYHVADAVLFVDRSGAADFHAAFATVSRAPLEALNRRAGMRLLLDRSSLEVFGGDGRAALTMRLAPITDGCSLVVYARDGEVRLTDLQLYRLRRVWS